MINQQEKKGSGEWRRLTAIIDDRFEKCAQDFPSSTRQTYSLQLYE